MYQQPHLVPPMKLTVYDQMPATPPLPPPSHLSKMMNQGRTLACKASERASFSTRKRFSSRPIISNPQAVVTRLPSARRYRPLELSIYAPQNRLSDLPDFDSKAVNFADDGAIQLPPRAMVRAKSQELRRTPSQRTPTKSKSMIEPKLLHRRTNTASTVVSTSRPPSNHDALRSHPVSWIEGSLPGLPDQSQCHHRNPMQATTILTPMQEEFTPTCTPACITINGTLLQFPKADPSVRPNSALHSPAVPPNQIISTAVSVSKTITLAPFKLSSPPPTATAVKKSRHPFYFSQYQDSPTLPQCSYSYTHGSSKLSISSRSSNSTKGSASSQSLSNWLSQSHQRGPSSSTSISTNTTRSFAEHRRKRTEFYQVRVAAVPSQTSPTMTSEASPPASTRIPFQQHFRHQRQRTLSVASSVGSSSTVDTDIMSLEESGIFTDVRSLEKNGAVHAQEKEIEVDMPFILQGPGIDVVDVGVAF
jgi:hypothetical protein